MAQEEEDPTREVDVDEEARRLSVGVTNVISWVIDPLSVLIMRTQEKEVHT